MTSRDRRRRQVADAIFADEIGLEYAIHEDFRLRSTYQPIFEPRGRLLRMVAVEAAVEAHRRGCAVSAAEFLDTLAPCERLYVDALCRMLHLRNYRHVGVEGVKLFFNFDFAANDLDGRMVAELRQMAGRLDELGLHPARLMCEIVVSCSDDSDTLDVLVQEMRAGGLGVALASFGTGNDTERLLNWSVRIWCVSMALSSRCCAPIPQQAACSAGSFPWCRTAGLRCLSRALPRPGNCRLLWKLVAIFCKVRCWPDPFRPGHSSMTGPWRSSISYHRPARRPSRHFDLPSKLTHWKR